jgi:hypothetical protein
MAKELNIAMIIAGVVIIALLSGLVGASLFPKEVIKTEIVNNTVEVPGPEVIVEKNVTVEVPVDNGKLADFITYLESKGVCDEDEDCVANAEFEMSALERAVDFIETDGVEEFDNCDLRDVDFDDYRDSELSVSKIYGDLDEVVVSDIDYDDEEAEFEIEVKIKGKDGSDITKINYIFTVFVDEDGVEVENIEEV